MRVEPNQNLELIVGPGDPISGNRTSNSVFYKCDVKVFWSQKRGWEDTKGSHFLRRKRKSFYEGPYHVVRKMALLFSLPEAGKQQIGWVLRKYQGTMGAVRRACYFPNVNAKIDSTITKYIGHNFTKVTTFIIIIKTVTLVKLFAKASWCRRCQHRAHHNRTPPC